MDTTKVEQFGNMVSINMVDLEQEFINQAKNYFLVSTELANAIKEYETAKESLRNRKALLALTLKTGSTTKMTVADIENSVDSDPEIFDLTNRTVELEYNKNLIMGVLKSLDNKREMLKALSWAQPKSESF